MAKLIADVGPAAGKALVATHIDSWENGSQNWTARMREEFQTRRGYDLLPLPAGDDGPRRRQPGDLGAVPLGPAADGLASWCVENYAGHMAELAHANGLRFTIEAYGGPCDDLPYAGRADEPMGEFWIGGGALETLQGDGLGRPHLRQADRRRGGVHGRRTGSAGCSTRRRSRRWATGPSARASTASSSTATRCSRGSTTGPGMTMGPWGLHYERTQTWWELAGPWHEYLARCQYLLRQGPFVADICYLQPEASPQEFKCAQRGRATTTTTGERRGRADAHVGRGTAGSSCPTA